MVRYLSFLLVAAFTMVVANPSPLSAGTTGTIVGRIVDDVSGAPISGATVTIASPSLNASAVSDASGAYRFLSLAPDSYQVSASRAGYDAYAQAGVSVFADQTHVVDIKIHKTLQEIGRVTSRSASNLIKPGTTSDVYSISGARAEASAALGGPGNLNNAYSAISAVPGANVPQGQQGWFQQISIRGGDPYDQVGYELDGIPVNRVYDNSPQTFLSSLGQQELQVYTGGTPASSDGQGIAGYVNQVIKTGTHPGFMTINAGLASPAFYHKFSFEAGGATPNRL
ncbi:MAG: TonB-dependent receptor, partial [Candidatus Eremiobacteraeota bacterium]|nr:TonB-dependent receptor [Candidatus Eremiobacteraeota bacterium]